MVQRGSFFVGLPVCHIPSWSRKAVFSVSTRENALKTFFLRWRAYFQAQLPLGAQFAVQEPIACGWLEQLSCATRDHVDHVLTVIIGRLSIAKLMQSKASKTTVAFLQLKRNVHWKLAVTFHAVVPLVESIPKGELITKPVPWKGLNRWKYQWLSERDWTMGWLIDSSLRARPVGLRFLKRWAAGWYTLALTLVVIADIETSVDVFGILPVLLWFEVLAGHTTGDLETLSTNTGGATASLDCNRLMMFPSRFLPKSKQTGVNPSSYGFLCHLCEHRCVHSWNLELLPLVLSVFDVMHRNSRKQSHRSTSAPFLIFHFGFHTGCPWRNFLEQLDNCATFAPFKLRA